MNVVSSIAAIIGLKMFDFEEEKEKKRSNTNSMDLENDTQFQEARLLLWEVLELKEFLEESTKEILRSITNSLKQYGRITAKQKELVLDIKEKALKKKELKEVFNTNSIQECSHCNNTGMLSAKNKQTNYKYYFRCFCAHAEKLSSKIPRWDINYELECEIL